MTLAIIYWFSFAALIITKVADVVSTIRWVSQNLTPSILDDHLT